jgi:hypothetical protein
MLEMCVSRGGEEGREGGKECVHDVEVGLVLAVVCGGLGGDWAAVVDALDDGD